MNNLYEKKDREELSILVILWNNWKITVIWRTKIKWNWNQNSTWKSNYNKSWKKHDGWWKISWTGNFYFLFFKKLFQFYLINFIFLKKINECATPVFEVTHPNAIGIFAFDNSTSHAAFAPDALVASHMNVNPRGKQSKMRDTVFNG